MNGGVVLGVRHFMIDMTSYYIIYDGAVDVPSRSLLWYLSMACSA